MNVGKNCKRCRSNFCKEHYISSQHDRIYLNINTNIADPEQIPILNNRCIECNKGLYITKSPECESYVCMSHRFIDQHNCS